MRIEVLLIEGCPNAAVAFERTHQALAQMGLAEVPVHRVVVSSATRARRPEFAGSPTIVCDGADLFPTAVEVADVACRVYRTDAGFAGVPSCDEIATALGARLAG